MDVVVFFVASKKKKKKKKKKNTRTQNTEKKKPLPNPSLIQLCSAPGYLILILELKKKEKHFSYTLYLSIVQLWYRET